MNHTHLLTNLGVAGPIHFMAAMTPPISGPLWLHALRAPIGIGMAYHTGKRMDEKRLSELEAVLEAGTLASSLAHLNTSRLQQLPLAQLDQHWSSRLARGIFNNPSRETASKLHMGLGTLGLTLPLYLYYRKGLKPQESTNGNDNVGGDR